MKNLGSLFYKPKKNEKDVSAKRWNIFSILGKAIRKTCTAIGAMVLISAILSIVMVTKFAGKSAKPLPDDMVLVLKVEGGFSEVQATPTLLEPFPFSRPNLRNVVDTLDKARLDSRVRGLIFSLKGGTMSISHIQELRAAITRFKESGKFTKIYAPSYIDGLGGLGQYYLASQFDEIWMQPVGMLSISGINLEMPFAREVLDKLGVNPQFFQREEFKSAMENFTNSEISDANKTSLASLVNDLSSRMIKDIAVSRNVPPQRFRAQMDKGILTGKEANAAKLIDRLDYADVMVSEIRKEVTGDPDDESVELISLGRYSQDRKNVAPPMPSTLTKKKDIALIYVVGAIVDDSKSPGDASASKIAAAIQDAYNDENIEAIVLRVDSPGGSPSASETIRRAIVKAKEKGKKIIVSMSSVAASGGYWVSADADRIFALPGTLTGSIGVVMGKFEASKLWEKIGVNWDGAKSGENADIWSINQPFDEAANRRMNVLIDDVYDSFLSRVATGRNLSKEQVRQIAKGRAWTGEQAKSNGLVDQLGGLTDALDYTAKQLGGINRTELNIVRMPRERNKIEQLLQMFGQQVSIGHFLQNNAKFFEKIQSVLKQTESVQRQGVYDGQLEAFR